MRVLTATAAAIALAVAGLGAPPAARADHHPAVIPSDFNGDGYPDLAVGMPREAAPDGTRWLGRVVVLYGSPDGLSTRGSQSWSASTPGLPAPPAAHVREFGVALTTADFDDDGFADLAIAASYRDPGFDERRGVWLLYGGPDGLTADGSQLREGDIEGSPGSLGLALAAVDVDGDGYPDLLAGAGAWTSGMGRTATVVALSGGPDGVAEVARRLLSVDSIYAGVMALAAGDLDGDGTGDVVMGLDGRNPGGTVHVAYGARSTATAPRVETWGQESPGIVESGAGDLELDEFGTELAIGDFDGDGFGDLAVGVPAEDLGDRDCGHDSWGDPLAPYGFCDQGAVHVIRGSAAGLTAEGDRLWTQASRGVPGRAGAGHRFGTTLVAGDFDADGFADLAVGAPDERLPGGAGEERWRAGSVTVLYGGPRGLGASRARRWTQDTLGVPGPAVAGDRFGSALTVSAGRFDRPSDLAIGIPGDRVRGARAAGMIVVLPGSRSGLLSAGATAWSQSTPGVPGQSERDDEFGSVLAR
ncbi:MAG: FG-GAP-like repeat-containing protein [Chloroflexota bacterium]